MKYVKPIYEKEELEATDVILASTVLGNGVILTEISKTEAKVGASVLDILGLR